MPKAERAMAVIRDFIQHRPNEIVQRLGSNCVCFRSACGVLFGRSLSNWRCQNPL